MTPADDLAYDAFISYSRRDGPFADQLYRTLSAYLPPTGLGLPRRRLRVFLDRSDFTGAGYSEALRTHLERARKLIVICSPHARSSSKYIDEEIEIFVRARGAANVIPVLLAGIPDNEALPAQEAEMAFPPALRAAIAIPLARDYRRFAAGTRHIDRGAFSEPWYFLLADLYDKSRSEIERREQTRRLRTLRRLLAGAAALLLVLSGLTAFALLERRAAVARLIRAHLTTGKRALEDQDVPAALLWYAAALQQGQDEEPCRIRLRTLLGEYPRLVRICTAPRLVADFSTDGARVVAADGPRAARVFEVGSGRAAAPPLPHGAAVTQVAFSPDGRRVVTGCEDGAARLWDAATGSLLHTLALGRPIRQTRFSPDGDRVAAAGEDGLVRVWHVANGAPLGPALVHGQPLRELRFSPDGSRIGTILDDRTVFTTLSVWDAATGQLAGPLLKRSNEGFALSCHGGQRFVYADCDHEAISVADALTGAPLTPSMRPGSGVERVSFSADGRFLLITGQDHSVRLWNTETGEPSGPPLAHGPAVTAAALAPDGRSVLTIDYNHVARVWDGSTGQETRAPIAGTAQATWSPRGDRIVTVDADAVRVTNASNGFDVTGIMRQAGGVHSVTLSPDARHLLVTGTKAAGLWQLEQEGYRPAPVPSNARRLAAGFDARGRAVLLAGVGAEGSARVFALADGEPLTPPLEHAAHLHGAAFGAGGRVVATQAFRDQAGAKSIPFVQLWDTATGAALTPPLQGVRLASELPASADGRQVLLVSDAGEASVWDLHERRLAARAKLPPGPIAAAAFTAAGPCVVVFTEEQVARVWSVTRGAAVGADLKCAAKVQSAWLAPAGDALATLDEGDELRIWQTRSGTFVTPRNQDDDRFKSFYRGVFSPDGAWLATAANGGSVRIWSVRTGEPRTAPMASLEFARELCFTPDGRYLIAATDDGAARIWDAGSGDLVGELRGPPFVTRQNASVAQSGDGRTLLVAVDAYVQDFATSESLVRTWHFAPEERSADRLALLAQLMAGRRIDASGTLTRLTSAELSALWSEYERERP